MDPPFKLEQGHRWFAITLNNRTWDLLEQHTRTPAEDEEMLHAAHAAAYHWRQVGTPLNQLRAEYLVALVHAKLGLAESAKRHAVRSLLLAKSKETAPFDLALVLAAAHQAAKLVGDSQEAATFKEKAEEACLELEEEERTVVGQYLGEF